MPAAYRIGEGERIETSQTTHSECVFGSLRFRLPDAFGINAPQPQHFQQFAVRSRTRPAPMSPIQSSQCRKLVVVIAAIATSVLAITLSIWLLADTLLIPTRALIGSF